jgi:hypothetical protein
MRKRRHQDCGCLPRTRAGLHERIPGATGQVTGIIVPAVITLVRPQNGHVEPTPPAGRNRVRVGSSPNRLARPAAEFGPVILPPAGGSPKHLFQGRRPALLFEQVAKGPHRRVPGWTPSDLWRAPSACQVAVSNSMRRRMAPMLRHHFLPGAGAQPSRQRRVAPSLVRLTIFTLKPDVPTFSLVPNRHQEPVSRGILGHAVGNSLFEPYRLSPIILSCAAVWTAV